MGETFDSQTQHREFETISVVYENQRYSWSVKYDYVIKNVTSLM